MGIMSLRAKGLARLARNLRPATMEIASVAALPRNDRLNSYYWARIFENK